MRVMEEAVKDGIGDGVRGAAAPSRRGPDGVADPTVPVLDGQLRGDDNGVALGAIVHDFQQILSAARRTGICHRTLAVGVNCSCATYAYFVVGASRCGGASFRRLERT